MTTKETVLAVLDRLPDDCTIEDVQYHLWSTSASIALDEVVGYINQSSPQNARQVLMAALNAAASLSTLAKRGRVVREVDDPSNRELIVLGYRLMYHVTETTVTILAFVRSRWDVTPRADN